MSLRMMAVLKLRVLFLVSMLTNVVTCQQEKRKFLVMENRRCDETSMSSHQMVTQVECVFLCQRMSGCDAVNYNRQTRECELLDGDEDGECSVTSDVSSVYIFEELYFEYDINCKYICTSLLVAYVTLKCALDLRRKRTGDIWL